MAMIKGAVATVAAVAVTGCGVGPAVGQTYRHHDARHDVVESTYTYNTTTDTQHHTVTPAPQQTNGDITALVARHTAHRVIVTIRHAALYRPKSAALTTFAQIKTGSGRSFVVAMELDTKGRRWLMAKPRSSAPVSCRFGHRFETATHTVRFSVPRSCLGRPRLVRVAGATTIDWGEGKKNLSIMHEYADDALQSGLPAAHRHLVWSPWLKRG